MNVYSSYNHIKMVGKYEPPTTFYADNNIYIYIYHYMVMYLEMISASNTYQRMMDNLFANILGVTMEAYVDDMLVNCKIGVDHETNQERPFTRMKLHRI